MIVPIQGSSIKLLRSDQETFNVRNERCTQDNEEYCQYVTGEMLSKFQVNITPIDGTELITNPDFQFNINDWTAIYGGVNYASDYGGSAEFAQIASPGFHILSQSVSVDANSYYYIEMKIRDCVFPDTPYGYFGVNAGSTIPNISGDYVFNTDGDRILRKWFNSGSNTTIDLSIAANCSMFIEYVTMVELSIPVAEVRVCGENTKTADANVQLYKDVAIIWADWSTLDNGCYNICVFPDGDTANNLLSCSDGVFTNDGSLLQDSNGNCIISG